MGMAVASANGWTIRGGCFLRTLSQLSRAGATVPNIIPVSGLLPGFEITARFRVSGFGLGTTKWVAQLARFRCRAKIAHIRQSRPDSGLGFRVKVLKTFEVVPSSLGSGRVREWLDDQGGVLPEDTVAAVAGGSDGTEFVSHKVFLKSFCKSQFPHKSVNLFLYEQ